MFRYCLSHLDSPYKGEVSQAMTDLGYFYTNNLGC